MTLIADTSSLVSLGSVHDQNPSPLILLLEHYDVAVPRQVIDELETISDKSQTDKDAADAVLSLKDELEIHDINPSTQRFDLGENAAIALSEELDAGYFLCDEFTNVMAIHASLGEAELVTTPNLLKVLFKRGELSKQEATRLLDDMTTARNWEGNSYIKNARGWFESQS